MSDTEQRDVGGQRLTDAGRVMTEASALLQPVEETYSVALR